MKTEYIIKKEVTRTVAGVASDKKTTVYHMGWLFGKPTQTSQPELAKRFNSWEAADRETNGLGLYWEIETIKFHPSKVKA